MPGSMAGGSDGPARRRPILPDDPSGSGLALGIGDFLGRDVFLGHEVVFLDDPTDEGRADIAILVERHRAGRADVSNGLALGQELDGLAEIRHRGIDHFAAWISEFGDGRGNLLAVLVVLGCHHGESDNRGGVVAGVAPWTYSRCVPALFVSIAIQLGRVRLRRAGSEEPGILEVLLADLIDEFPIIEAERKDVLLWAANGQP